MTTPGGIGPERLAEIVDGAPPRDDEERAMLALMEETRALEPGASDELRRRVLDGPPPRPASRLSTVRGWLAGAGTGGGRRRLLVGAPVVAGIIALAVAIPVLNDDGSSDAPMASADDPAAATGAGSPESATVAPPAARESLQGADPVAPAAPGGSGAADAAKAAAAAGIAPSARAPVPAPGRARQVTATTRVQVDGVEALSKASASAMRTVRSLGGFTASSDYSVPNGAQGTNRLVFRVPVDRAEDALAAFGRLGTVTAQNAEIVDLTARLGRQTSAVDALTATVAGLRAEAAADPGDAALAAELARAEAALARAEDARGATLDRTDLATLRLTLTTEGPPAPAGEEGRFGGPISRAGDRLAGATAWLLGAAVLVGPFLLLALAAGWGPHAPARPVAAPPDGLRLNDGAAGAR